VPARHCGQVPLDPDNLDKVLTELVAVSRSAMSKREEAANLARIWGRLEDATEGPPRAPGALTTEASEGRLPGAEFRVTARTGRVRRLVRWRPVA
jgi:hypothetical protein